MDIFFLLPRRWSRPRASAKWARRGGTRTRGIVKVSSCYWSFSAHLRYSDNRVFGLFVDCIFMKLWNCPPIATLKRWESGSTLWNEERRRPADDLIGYGLILREGGSTSCWRERLTQTKLVKRVYKHSMFCKSSFLGIYEVKFEKHAHGKFQGVPCKTILCVKKNW